jgi:outer membrane protein TolC
LPLRGVSEDAIIRGQDPAGLYAPTPIRRFRSDEASQPHPVDSEAPGNRYAAVNSNSPATNASENNFPAARAAEQSWPESTKESATPDASSTEMQNANPQLYLPLTLQDAIESALSDSSIVRTLEGRVNIAEITPNDVAIADARIDAERGRFQPELSANFDGSQVNQPPNAFFGPGIAANTRRDVGDANLRITQPLQTGGSVSIGIEPPTAYLYFPDGVGAGEFNPIYSTDYVIRVKQPVLRGAGRRIALAPVRIAQTQANQSRWELEEVLNSQIRSITQSYWQLYAAHLQLHAVRSVMPLAEESVRIEMLRLEADRSILADVARARVQLDGFRRTETGMQGTLRKRVLQLRQLMGGQPMVDPLLLPSEKPVESQPPAESAALIQVSMMSRPSLNLLRERIKERCLVLGIAENAVLPSLDLRGDYWMNGLAERLDDSFKQAGSGEYSDWTLGFGVDVPLGNKTARSRRRMAELSLAREQMRLTATEQSVAFEITELVSDLQAAWQRTEIARRQTQETQEWLRVSRIRYTQPPAAGTTQDWLLLALTDLQSAMRSYVDAISDLSGAVADYNTLLAELQQAQGMSVYEWRQHAAPQEVFVGHSSPGYSDYRTRPVPLQSTQVTASEPFMTNELIQIPQHLPPSTGHSFLAMPRGDE